MALSISPQVDGKQQMVALVTGKLILALVVQEIIT